MASCIRRVVWMVASLWSMDRGLEGAVVELRVVPGLVIGPVLAHGSSSEPCSSRVVPGLLLFPGLVVGRLADPGLADPGLDDVVEVGPGLAVGPVLDVRAFTDRAFFAFFV